jgi:uncharacterized RDD family membrane protein YckC
MHGFNSTSSLNSELRFMLCSICGEICRCSSTESSNPLPRWLPDEKGGRGVDELPTTAPERQPTESSEAKAPSVDGISASANLPSENVEAENPPAWREELAARLNRYHSRRKPRPPRYPSLRLQFKDDIRGLSGDSDSISQVAPAVSNHALALERFEEIAQPKASELPPFELQPFDVDHDPHSQPPAPTARIIEFPRFWTPPPPSRDELAEPVMERPRILEVPEVVPPPPALGGITIEPVEQPALEKRPGIDLPLQGAPLARRVFSAFIDAAIVTSNCALFSFIFWKMTGQRPPVLQIAGVLASLWIVLWAAYQYLLLVYTGSTPGLSLARLRLVRFDSSMAARQLRRWRVLASFLSAFSLGMGYAWVFLDEDSLCWHDRITHTYLEEKK